MAALALVSVMALCGGCIEDIVRARIPVPGNDMGGYNPEAGIGVDADGLVQQTQLKVLRIKPDHGTFAGGNQAVITGTGFAKGMSIKVGKNLVQPTDITLLSPIAVQVVMPPGDVGQSDVEVTRGSDKATLAKGYRYDPLRLDPSSGPTVGGTLVTVYSRGLTFAKGMTATLGAKPMTQLDVLSTSAFRAVAPAGSTGPATLKLSLASGDVTINEAYTYYLSVNPRSGGLGGGKIKGTLTVTVLNRLDRSPLPTARVVVQKERSVSLSAVTGLSGAAVFTRVGLTGPLSVTAGLKGFETSSIVSFNARDVTIFLLPRPQPQAGSVGVGTYSGVVRGNVVFGGATGIGSGKWQLVPEPKKDQVKRVYVYTTSPSLAWGPPYAGSGATIDFDDSGARAWPFVLYAYPGSLAIYAIAGLYHKTRGTFEPYAMGITRGISVGPGEGADADIWVTIPLDQKVKLSLKNLPQGVAHHRFRLALDLGADGLIMRDDHEVDADGLVSAHTFARLPALNHKGLLDATYTVEVRLDSGESDSLPQTVATLTMAQPKDGVLTVDNFVGVPRQVRPVSGAAMQGNTLAWSSGSGATPNLALTYITLADDTPVWRVYSPGTVTRVKLPDPSAFGLPAWPRASLVWTQYLARLPSFSFDNFNYSHASGRYWDRWSQDRFTISGP